MDGKLKGVELVVDLLAALAAGERATGDPAVSKSDLRRLTDEALKARDNVIARLDQRDELLAAAKGALETMTAEDACNIPAILGSHNPHEHAAGALHAAIARAEDQTP